MAFPLQFLLETALSQLLGSTGKKKKRSKKDDASADILDIVHLTVKKFRKVTKEVGKLSTGQKLLGGVALAATGLAYLAARDTDEAPAAETPPLPPPAAAQAAAPRKPRKTPKKRPGPETT